MLSGVTESGFRFEIDEEVMDDMEFLDVKKYSAREMEELIAKGEFQQAVHITAWLLAQRRGSGAVTE